MKQRSTFFLAIGLAVFVVVLVGAVSFSIAVKTLAKQTAPSKPASVQNTSRVGRTLVESRVVHPTSVPAASNAAITQPGSISAERAARIAMDLIPGGLLQQPPELVNYQGRMAYEVLVSGSMIYIDASSGKILGTVAVAAPNQSSQGDTNGNSGGGNSGDQINQTFTPVFPEPNQPQYSSDQQSAPAQDDSGDVQNSDGQSDDQNSTGQDDDQNNNQQEEGDNAKTGGEDRSNGAVGHNNDDDHSEGENEGDSD